MASASQEQPQNIFVVSVYGQSGYVDAQQFSNQKRDLFHLLDESGEKMQVNADQHEVIHRGNITNDYEFVDGYLLVHTPVHKSWEAYRHPASFPPPFVTSEKNLSALKQKLGV